MEAVVDAFVDRGYAVDRLFFRSTGPNPPGLPAGARVVDLRSASAWTWLLLRAKPLSALAWTMLITRRLLARPYPTAPRFWILRCLAALCRYLRERQPLAVISIGDRANFLIACARHVARDATPVIMGQHNSMAADCRLTAVRTAEWRSRLALRLYRSALLAADAIVTPSEGTTCETARVARIPRSRITTVLNCVVSPELRDRANAPLEHPWFAAGAAPVVLGVGRLVEQKNFAALLAAFAKVCRVRPARLMILGEGEQREELATLARRLDIGDRIAMPGFVDNPLSYMSRAGVFVSSSAWEPFGIVVLEALLCGCPIVATRCFGHSRLLDDGRFGRIVPQRDDTALADAILATLDDPPPRERLIERAMQFTTDRLANGYAELIPR